MKTTKLWFTTGIIILIVAILLYFDELFMTILIAAVLAFLLNPITNWFQKVLKTKKRFFPTLLTLLLAFAVVGGLLWLFLPPLYRQIETVIVSIDDYIEMLSNLVDQLAVKLARFPFSDKLVGGVDRFIEGSEDEIIAIVTTVGRLASVYLLVLHDITGQYVRHDACIPLERNIHPSGTQGKLAESVL